MKLVWSLVLMFAAFIAAALQDAEAEEELTEQALDMFGGEKP